jgi:predicted amidophosphoribosyltransferase
MGAFSNLFFPENCYACGSDLVGADQLLCLRCLHQLPYTQFEQLKGNPVEKIFWGRIPIQQAGSLFYFTKGSVVEKLLHQLKYRSKKEAGLYWAYDGRSVEKSGSYAGIDFIIPFPYTRKGTSTRF